MNQHQQPLIFFRVDLNMNHHRHHPTFFFGGGCCWDERYNSRILVDADGRLQGGSVKLDFDVAQEPEAANAQLQLSKQDVFGDGVFFLGDDWGSRGLFYFYLCWEVALFIFLLFFSYYFLGCFQMFGLDQLAFLLHHPSSSFPSMIHDPRSRSL